MQYKVATMKSPIIIKNGYQILLNFFSFLDTIQSLFLIFDFMHFACFFKLYKLSHIDQSLVKVYGSFYCCNPSIKRKKLFLDFDILEKKGKFMSSKNNAITFHHVLHVKHEIDALPYTATWCI